MAITDVNDGDILTGTVWQTVIDTVENLGDGHDHDGTDSKAINIFQLSGNPVKYVTSEMSAVTHTGDTNQANMGVFTISANTVKHGIMISGIAYRYGDGNDVTWKIHVGGVAKLTQTQDVCTVNDIDHKNWVPLQWLETAQTWTNEISVGITVQLADGSDDAGLDNVIITGF